MDSALRETVRSRVETLQRLDLDAVENLPPQQREDDPSLGKIAVIQYHDVTDVGDHRVVVQGARQRWFGIFTAIEVDGFVLEKGGIKRPLTEPEKWPYM
ncbi:MAG: hypothetical protein ABIQ86_14260 [Steroidobacteraceae bacterium]